MNANVRANRGIFGINRDARVSQISDGNQQHHVDGRISCGGHGERCTGHVLAFSSCGSALFTTSTPNSSAPDVLSNSEHKNWCQWRHNFPGENLPCAPSEFCSPHVGDGHAAARSRHIGGVQIVMADGSVHFVEDWINLNLWWSYITISGKETVD